MIARDGQYEPFLDEVQGDRRRLDEATQRRRLMEQEARTGGVGREPPTAMAANAAAPLPGAAISAPQVTCYGDLGARMIETGSR